MPATAITLFVHSRKKPDGCRPYLQRIKGKNNRFRAGCGSLKKPKSQFRKPTTIGALAKSDLISGRIKDF